MTHHNVASSSKQILLNKFLRVFHYIFVDLLDPLGQSHQERVLLRNAIDRFEMPELGEDSVEDVSLCVELFIVFELGH